jgi:uncharacterized protein YcfL
MNNFTLRWYRGAVIIMVIAALFTGGCSSTAGVEATGKKTWNQEGAPELSKRIVINNRSLASDIEIIDMKSTLAGDLMKVQVAMRSRDRDIVQIQYKFDWFDAEGMEIGANQGAWKPFLIYGRETRTIQGVAPDPRAREFKLKVREPDNT